MSNSENSLLQIKLCKLNEDQSLKRTLMRHSYTISSLPISNIIQQIFDIFLFRIQNFQLTTDPSIRHFQTRIQHIPLIYSHDPKMNNWRRKHSGTEKAPALSSGGSST